MKKKQKVVEKPIYTSEADVIYANMAKYKIRQNKRGFKFAVTALIASIALVLLLIIAMLIFYFGGTHTNIFNLFR